MRIHRWPLFAACLILSLSSYASDYLTFEERVKAQEAIERVYYRHRIWPQDNPGPRPPFEYAVKRAQLEAKVRATMQKSALLEAHWGRPITGEQLQAEMNRMAQQTRDASMLRELFAALNDDPFLVAECLARPILADRLSRGWYAFDGRLHQESRSAAERLLAFLITNPAGSPSGAPGSIVDVQECPEQGAGGAGSTCLDRERFLELAAAFPSPEAPPAIEEEHDAFNIRLTAEKSAATLNGRIFSVAKRPYEAWLALQSGAAGGEELDPPDAEYRLPAIGQTGRDIPEPDHPDDWKVIWSAPESRTAFTAVWTGTEMIIWGGYSGGLATNNGGIYNPVTDTWAYVSVEGAPARRTLHSAVWTGEEMIIWGGNLGGTGYLGDGGRYNPITNTWVGVSPTAAPTPREEHSAVWTGREMIVWGGKDLGGWRNTGGRYNPSLDDDGNAATPAWTAVSTTSVPDARSRHACVWTGMEMLVWGGTRGYALGDGGRYNPDIDSWQAINSWNAPQSVEGPSAVWTGMEMIVWGGNHYGYANSGGRYNPSLDAWKAMGTTLVPEARDSHTAVWTGVDMIVWGGQGSSGALGTGGRYNPGYDDDGDPFTSPWRTISAANAPTARYSHKAVWTGAEMIVWGGYGAGVLRTGGRYRPAYDDDGNPATAPWVATSTGSIPSGRSRHSAAWTGTEMIIWGGNTGEATLNTGTRFDPALNSWTALPLLGAPAAREQHSVVWTGAEMIVWGGCLQANSSGFCLTYSDTGGRYEPAGDQWKDTPLSGAPILRKNHSAVWTGADMIIWGGGNGTTEYLDTGGRYSPANDDDGNPGTPAWTSVSTAGAPAPRKNHSAVWTGTEMIVWGGYAGGGLFLDTGGRYRPSWDDDGDPGTEAWTATRTSGAPAGRRQHTAVWDGTEMIVWGGDNASTPNGTLTGGRYSPPLDQWTATSSVAAPGARTGHTAVWTGQEMIVWGGFGWAGSYNSTLNTGGRYIPENDRDVDPLTPAWREVSIGNAPSPRWYNSAVWTGREMIIWAGSGGDSGAAYYTNTDPIARLGSRASFDPVRGAPACYNAVNYCTTDTLVVGRDGAAGIEEPNQPNTLSGSCEDGKLDDTTDEHIDAIVLFTKDGSPLTPGKEVIVETTLRVHDPVGGSSDNAFDLYTTASLDLPAWDRRATTLFVAGGHQTLRHTLVLPSSMLQAMRTQLRRLHEDESPCAAGGDSHDDRDDLILDASGTAPYATFTLGSGMTIVLDGSVSADGSNPEGAQAFQDPFDSLTFEWDLNEDAGYSTGCRSAASGADYDDPALTLNESDLAAFNIATPGDHTVWLRVTDESMERDCIAGVIRIVDGISPAISVTIPDGGESWAYSESAAERQQHLIVWSASDNFPPLGRVKLSYTANGGSTWTCFADTNDGNGGATCAPNGLAVSDLSYWWTMPTSAEADASGQTFPSATCRVKVDVWDESGNTASDTSDANFYIIQPTTTAVKTLILWNSARVEAKYGTSAKTSLASKLGELADHGRVAGVVLDLNAVPAVVSAYAAWDAAPTNQALANAVASAIRTYVMGQIETTYTNAQFLQLVGDDVQIPFYRLTDGATIHTEGSYPGEGGLSAATTVGSALTAGYFLTDNYYGEYGSPTGFEPSGIATPPDNAYIYLNDFAVGRLVETPDQIAGVINVFLAQDGQVTFTGSGVKAMVSGWDFMYDSALAVQGQYAGAGKTTDCLLDDPAGSGTSDPCVDQPFTPADLSAQLFNSPLHTVATLNTHGLHYALAGSAATGGKDLLCTSAGYGTGCWATGMDANGVALTATVLYTPACHAGLSVPATEPTRPLDLPEQMAKKGVPAYIANTGYGWGMDVGSGLSEMLMEGLTSELLNHDSIAVGKALADAKRGYCLQERRWDVFDEKVVHELTLYGIPNTLLVSRQTRGQGDGLPPPDGPDTGCADGICLEKHLSSGEGLLPGGVTELNLNFTFCGGALSTCTCPPQSYPDCTYQLITTGTGNYYKLNNRASGEVGATIQPHFVYNSYLSGTLAHGVLFTGGAYECESPFNPVVAAPSSTAYDPGGENDQPAGSSFIPSVRASFGTAGGLGLRALGQIGYTNLTVHTGFYDGTPPTGSECRFAAMQFVHYYSNAADTVSPAVTDPGAGGFHALAGLTATFTATVTDAGGLYRVLVTYNDARTAQWKSFDLTNASGSTWTGALPLKGSITYYLQAVDQSGNVGILATSGADLDPNGTPYGSTWSGPKMFAITLPDTDADSLPDAYEDLHPACLNKNTAGQGALDPDYDRLTSAAEFSGDTDPCDGDSDGGGENDGSELNANGTTPKRNPLYQPDDKRLTLFVVKNGANYDLSWPPASGDNGAIDGYYFVYRSDTPFFDPTDRVNATPIADGTAVYTDVAPPCSTCFYNVWNYQLDTLPPMVAAVAPSVGPAAGGTSVGVYGSNFQSGAKVYFDNVLATNVTFVNVSMLTCTTPAHAAGAVTVKVVNPNAQEGTLPSAFTFQ